MGQGVVSSPISFNPNTEWIINPIDDITSIGSHVNNCSSPCTNVYTILNDSICAGDSVLFGGVYYTSTGSYYDTTHLTNDCDLR